MLASVLEDLAIPYFITGGMAAIAYGEPRFTSDIDVVADLQDAHVAPLLARFPGPAFYLSEQAVRTAVAHRFHFNVLHPSSGGKIDFMAASPSEYDRTRLSRRRRIALEDDLQPYFAAPEDVILKKLEFYQLGGSEKHLRDVASILLVLREQVDRAYVERWSAVLNIAAEWQLVQQRVPRAGA